MKFDELKLDNQLCHRIYTANNGIMRLYKPLLKKIGLTYTQYIIMMVLWENDNLSMSQLAKTSKMDKGFLTTAIKKMANEKLISINSDPSDQRKKNISLTIKGKKIKNKARCIPHEILELINLKDSNINENDILRFIQVLDRINIVISEKH